MTTDFPYTPLEGGRNLRAAPQQDKPSLHRRPQGNALLMEHAPLPSRYYALNASQVNDSARFLGAAAFALFAVKELAIALAVGAAVGGLSWAAIEWVL